MYERVKRRAVSAAQPFAWPHGDEPEQTVVSISKTSRPMASTRSQSILQAAAVIKRSRLPVTELLNQVRLGKAIEIDTVLNVVKDVQRSVEQSPSALISLTRIRSKDEFTYMHSIAVCALMINLGRELDFPASSLQEIGIAGLLHDIGKMLIPEAVLNKAGALSPAETNIVRTHAERGYEILQRSRHLPEVAMDVCLSHHEKIDGSGYPRRLAGAGISLPARMAAVCDVYDAMSSKRPYKEAGTPSECLQHMFSWQGHFDDKILAAFIKSIGIYPVGSLVKLESAHLALVVDQHKQNLTRPIVRAFYNIHKRTKIQSFEIDLASESDRVVSREDPRRWGFLDWDRQWPRMIR
ncbi:MAG: HD-GYP domain-containing protein [Allosphingosinicella sp.]|uniref:HD-GYP domain-containing protein n=1 Tax=Allosphingosinicella sp. TaxID=2823234 RepID=UPI00396015E4